jgi:cellulose synthase/poly-beta-1,6-N-acetylglucosamine synthase-like glycosyltransferase
LDYPRECLEILLIVEEVDTVTRTALARTPLARHMRVVVVPDGSPRTKPRALNFALNFARGSIIGIYDAEDHPEPDQIWRVVRRFATAPDDVACLQGRLDYYNPTHNWVARCFTIEYATWFRVMLRGVQALRLFVAARWNNCVFAP